MLKNILQALCTWLRACVLSGMAERSALRAAGTWVDLTPELTWLNQTRKSLITIKNTTRP